MITEITEPTLLLNKDICRSNIKAMAEKARNHDLIFKPHMKTHQSAEIGQWFKEEGVTAITVSSINMAQYFARNGWEDITIAFPVNVRKLAEIDKLAEKITLTLLVTNERSIQSLKEGLSNSVNVYIEIDTGGKRSGVEPSNLTQIQNLIHILECVENLNWIGFYSHPGHSYQARNKTEIKTIHRAVLDQFGQLKESLNGRYSPYQTCIGDTPCCTVADDFANIDAISPGNFVFYDLMQYEIGSCDIRDIALVMACPIVDKYPSREELIIHGGAIHFSKESINVTSYHYGLLAEAKHDTWTIFNEKSYLKALSQEHGIISCPSNMLDDFEIGDLLFIFPVHSCLTANLMGSYTLQNGKIIKQYN